MRRCLPLNEHWARQSSHNGADMLICLIFIHDGHRISSGFRAPDEPPLMRPLQCMYIQTTVSRSVYSTQWWRKVVASVIYSVHLHQPLLAPRASLHPFCRLHAICQAVFWGHLYLSFLNAFETIALCHWADLSNKLSSLIPNQYGYICSPRLILNSARRWTDISYMYGTILHFHALHWAPCLWWQYVECRV